MTAAYTSGGLFGYATPGLADLEYKQALYNFYAKVWDEGNLGAMTPGGYLYRATGSTLARAYAATYVYMLSAKDKPYSRVVFKIASAMNPSTGIDVRLVLYAVNLSSSFNQYNWGTYVYYPSDLIPHQVFAGKAASLSFAAGSGAFRSESATCICNTVLKGGAIYPTGTIFDLKQPFMPDGPTSIQMFLSVNEVVASPGVDTNTPYGLTFLQEHAIWFLP